MNQDRCIKKAGPGACLGERVEDSPQRETPGWTLGEQHAGPVRAGSISRRRR